MKDAHANPDAPGPLLAGATRFWERGRLLYNAVLTVIVLLWIALTWPDFRPSLTLGAFEAMVVLGLLANLCYSTAYVAEFFMQALLPVANWRRFRQVLWLLGTLFAIVLENYWIADEIYPAANQPPPAFIAPPFIGGPAAVPVSTIASNMNFPAPLAVIGFLAAALGLFCGIVAALVFWFARKPKFARVAAIAIAACAAIYFALLFGLSASSRETALSPGQEKYFCEIDCHLAYSVVKVKAQPDAASIRYVVTLRTRFDETTISPSRPKDAPLTPSPREVHLIDSSGREYAPAVTAGTPLLTPLKPADSYTTHLEFTVPKNATGLKLLLHTTPAWPDHVVIGDENSWLHKKTYFTL